MRALVVPFGLVALAVMALAVTRVSAPPAAANPPGNNGTIKVDRLAFDDMPNNEPHVGCQFQVDFYGFDEGRLYADLVFRAIPPSGHDEQLLIDTVFIGEDSNNGGGSDRGLDASSTYDLSATLSGLTAQPRQGYHVKLTIHADGAVGADTKAKVFWVEPCVTEPPAVIDESPMAVLLPVSAAGMALLTLAFLRRRERRAAGPIGEGRAAY